MKNVKYTVLIGMCMVLVLMSGQAGRAQNDGESPETGVKQSDLPPGAIYQGGEVLHVVRPNENLHLIAGFYYGDPRQWSRIYRENRSAIPNPRVLSVGQKLRISVPEGWQPLFPYQEWFRLATRNGEWAPGGGKRTIPQPSGSPPEVPTLSPTVETPPETQQPPPPQQQDVSAPPVTTPIEEQPVTPVKPVEVDEFPQEAEPPLPEETPVVESETQTPEKTPQPEDDGTVAPAF